MVNMHFAINYLREDICGKSYLQFMNCISLQNGIIYLYNYKDCLFYMLNNLVLCIHDLSEILKYTKFINDYIPIQNTLIPRKINTNKV